MLDRSRLLSEQVASGRIAVVGLGLGLGYGYGYGLMKGVAHIVTARGIAPEVLTMDAPADE
ncbi:hypothetical protein RGF97_01140 [Streptomyces roseicoloratus]|uniref:Uncharacterized protein n=1 Tax=Streptomyces roseicoloratus TaxID=2508722 RepID=A0ABY9S3Y1_9ACTN|nr:hypothetical protein [Streptomyces roseicoloratus]WMX49134.1 hypothetical protein RGF97_01140 [Streptomyces roseicoloratus]